MKAAILTCCPSLWSTHLGLYPVKMSCSSQGLLTCPTHHTMSHDVFCPAGKRSCARLGRRPVPTAAMPVLPHTLILCQCQRFPPRWCFAAHLAFQPCRHLHEKSSHFLLAWVSSRPTQRKRRLVDICDVPPPDILLDFIGHSKTSVLSFRAQLMFFRGLCNFSVNSIFQVCVPFSELNRVIRKHSGEPLLKTYHTERQSALAAYGVVSSVLDCSPGFCSEEKWTSEVAGSYD